MAEVEVVDAQVSGEEWVEGRFMSVEGGEESGLVVGEIES